MEAVPFRETTQGPDPLAAALDRCRLLEDHVQRLAAIVESSDEAIFAADPFCRVVFWSAGAEHLLGYQPSEMQGSAAALVFSAEHRAELVELAERARAGHPVREHETKALRKNGVVLDISLSMSPIRDEAGGFTGFCLVARDITDKRWMSDTLNSTLKSLEVAVAEARESEERCRRFTADAAHQIRTPIAGIRACAETLLRQPSPSEQETLLSDVVRETVRASRLMAALIQMARLDQGQTLRPVPCDVVGLCEAEVDRVRLAAPHLDFEVRVTDLENDRPDLDRHAVAEILANLLDNGSRHAARRIDVHVGTRGDEVVIRVVDDGPGVAPAMVARMFDRFVSLDGAGGTGLGLPIGQALARAHGGDLTYDDRSFVLRLPVRSTIDCGGAGRPDFDPTA
jgi:PAS domain S-box-containing protein